MDANKKDKIILSKKESYEVMLQFLKNWYDLTKNKDITDILSGAEYMDDGKPADSTFWDYWEDAIKEIKNQKNDPFKKWNL